MKFFSVIYTEEGFRTTILVATKNYWTLNEFLKLLPSGRLIEDAILISHSSKEDFIRDFGYYMGEVVALQLQTDRLQHWHYTLQKANPQ